uniref:Peptidase S1 domain-containing protein n=1 Tax=Oreochromis aureus TaxID=47969 RepID=A0A668RGW2_OREAU
MAFCKLLLTVLVLLHNSGLLGNEVRSSIIGAEDAQKERWPWMVHLNMTSSGSNRVKWRCGGTIVAKHWVLTSAHCLANNPDHRRSFVTVGAYQLQKAAKSYMAIANFVPEFDYQDLGNGNYKNDIALIKLKNPIQFSKDVAPVDLPDKDDTFGPSAECWITGWGEVGNVPLPDPETLQQLSISIMPRSTCKKTYPQIACNTLCGANSKGRDACKGNYGGPLVCRKGGKFLQVGIMSHGSPGSCGLANNPGVYTAVAKYLNFINDYVHFSENPSAFLYCKVTAS